MTTYDPPPEYDLDNANMHGDWEFRPSLCGQFEAEGAFPAVNTVEFRFSNGYGAHLIQSRADSEWTASLYGRESSDTWELMATIYPYQGYDKYDDEWEQHRNHTLSAWTADGAVFAHQTREQAIALLHEIAAKSPHIWEG